MDWTKKIEAHGWIFIGLDARGASLDYVKPVFTHPVKQGWIVGDGDDWVYHHKKDFGGPCDIPNIQG